MSVIATHVDDCIAFGEEEYVSATISAVKSIYSIRDLGFPGNMLGKQLRRTPEFIELTCPKLIDAMMARFAITPAFTPTPLPSDAPLTSFSLSDKAPDHSRYRQMLGCLNFIATHVRPDHTKNATMYESLNEISWDTSSGGMWQAVE